MGPGDADPRGLGARVSSPPAALSIHSIEWVSIECVAKAANPTTGKAIGTPMALADLGTVSTRVDKLNKKLNKVKLAKVREMESTMSSQDGDNEGKVSGRFTDDEKSIRSDGELTEDGPGMAGVRFVIAMADGKVIATLVRPQHVPGEALGAIS